MPQGNGGVVGPANDPTSSTASGVWGLKEHAEAVGAGEWPPYSPFSQISRSLRFNSADSAYLSWTPGVAATSSRKLTYSCWVKRSALAAYQHFGLTGAATNGRDTIRFENSDKIAIFLNEGGAAYLESSGLFRDVSAWYHIVVSVDTTLASNQIKLYVNNVQQTLTGTQPSQNYDFTGWLVSGKEQNIGRSTQGLYFYSGYETEINCIDGQALTPSSFGGTNATTGVWSPIAYAGSYGTNGFYLNFSDNSGVTSTTLGKDQAGSNNWTPNNFSVTAGAGNDSLVDTPTPYGTDTGAGGEVRGNYCTLNPLKQTGATLTNGNLQFTKAAGAGATLFTIHSTLFVSTGKWYFEVTPTSGVAGHDLIGVAGPEVPLATYASLAGMTGNIWAWRNDSYKVNNSSSPAQSLYGNTWSTEVIGVALDMDNGKIYWSINGTFQSSGDPAAGTNAAFTNVSGSVAPILIDQGSGTFDGSFNFGQRPFAYTAPSGFKALVTTNLPEPTVVQGDDYFNTVIYTGDGSNPRGITGVGFQPDFVWLKNRSAGWGHRLSNAVVGANYALETNNTNAELFQNQYGYLNSFNSDGFTVTAGSTDDYFTNNSGDNYVAWNWKADGAGSLNEAGTISSTVSVSTTSGFSVVTYTGNGVAGATRGHGLGVAPNMIIIKGRSNVDQWHVYHSSLGNTGGLLLNQTNAFIVSPYFWNDTSPSSTVFTTNLGSSNNQNGITYVAYCFAEVEGFSKFGSYTGNGTVDNVFLYTGFRPAFFMVKRTDSTSSWLMYDNKRNGYNYANYYALANTTYGGDGTDQGGDFLSNGIKIRADGGIGTGTYIYMAFAENPFKYSLAR